MKYSLVSNHQAPREFNSKKHQTLPSLIVGTLASSADYGTIDIQTSFDTNCSDRVITASLVSSYCTLVEQLWPIGSISTIVTAPCPYSQSLWLSYTTDLDIDCATAPYKIGPLLGTQCWNQTEPVSAFALLCESGEVI